MSDERKRQLIRFLNGFDRVSSKSLPARGWNHKTVTRDEPAWRKESENELDRMSGRDLNRELGQQILASLPAGLFLLAAIAAAVWVIVRI